MSGVRVWEGELLHLGPSYTPLTYNTSLAYLGTEIARGAPRIQPLLIIETSVFTRQIQAELDEESYLVAPAGVSEESRGWSFDPRHRRTAQDPLGCTGPRQEPWDPSDLLLASAGKLLLMLLAYSKNVQDDLRATQRKVLRDLVREEPA